MRLMEEILAIRPGPGRMAKWGGGVCGQAVYGVARVGWPLALELVAALR